MSKQKILLEKLNIPFTTHSPNIDETPRENESPQNLVERLAKEKASKVSKKFKKSIIIASDQVATFNDKIIGKPKDEHEAYTTLLSFSEKAIVHYTSLVVLDNLQGKMACRTEPFEVLFKKLSPELVQHYINSEKPLDCAGSVKSEGMGVMLFNHMKGRDPNSLIGLPLMALADCFDELGVKWF